MDGQAQQERGPSSRMQIPQMIQLIAFLLAASPKGGSTASLLSSATCWTAWFDSNMTSSSGEMELLSDLRAAFPGSICPNPIEIEAQTNGGLTPQQAKNILHVLDPSVGLICFNKDQRERACENYRVKFRCSGTFCTSCRTVWFSRDDASGNGDYELLPLLRKRYPGDICRKPIAIQAETIIGEPVSNTGDVITIFDASDGFICTNAAQSERPCQNYQVCFTCPEEFCRAPAECLTGWFNTDNPEGRGDIEAISKIKHDYPDEMCSYPTSIEAKTISGLSASLTPDFINEYDVWQGFSCLNQDQKACKDYSVKFACSPEFCRGCRTAWFNQDGPQGNGDYEIIAKLRREFPGQICSAPIGIEAQTTEGIPALETGQTFDVYDATFGFICLNNKQINGSTCYDYRVRFTCSLTFCMSEEQ